MPIRDANGEVNYRTLAVELINIAIEETTSGEEKIGILLCEGDDNSVDKAVYSLLFPDLHVIPVGGCTAVVRFTPRVRKNLMDIGRYVFGIIDRDALSKKEIKRLNQTTGVYTTKLPFIENIICAPETLRIVCEIKGIDYEYFLNRIEEELLKILWQRLKETLPINIGVEKNERILTLNIGVATRRKEIQKSVSKVNILYSYRDKIITSIVGGAMGLKGKKAYYNEILEMLQIPEYRPQFARVFSGFIPKFELYDFEN